MNCRIWVLINNTMQNNGLQCEHGLSLWIEYNGYSLLFDTGQSTKVIENAKALGIDLRQTDAIVISHGHYDHAGALPEIMELAKDAIVYCHPGVTKARYSLKKNQEATFVGLDRKTLDVFEDKKHRIVFNTGKLEIVPGVTLLTGIPNTSETKESEDVFVLNPIRKEKDCFEDEQVAVINSIKGLVVLSGCTHRGVLNTIDFVENNFKQKPISSFIGGLHLMHASDKHIEKVACIFREKFLDSVVPLHCTGKHAIDLFQKKGINMDSSFIE